MIDTLKGRIGDTEYELRVFEHVNNNDLAKNQIAIMSALVEILKVKEIQSKVHVTGQLPDCESRGKMHIIDLNIKKCIECGKDYTGNLQ